jgi:hypothetical protein
VPEDGRLAYQGPYGHTYVLAWVDAADIDMDELVSWRPVPARFLDRRARAALQVAWDFEEEDDGDG